ncbi:phosphate ABC transporter substrate-binding protein PstS [Streptomyces lacrimifluminis]|uniref:Phosphate-binding protein n=1 Tax=Streptomyces lacrimifluminis TaxID=1500077 RepID=A0A917NWW6_9ACTN|nr:phosphate ABC transporter substrate-binding protein PstS [Streptomyces lacrimifluminis]GGJ32931.1 phosphate-binding protein PstS [Streptomyces lacrimifluminis]
MQRRTGTRRSRLGTPAAVAGLAVGLLLVAGCGFGDPVSGDDRTTVTVKSVADIDCARTGRLPGSGSTAQANAMSYWIRQYQQTCPPVRIAYNPVGTGGGVGQFLQGYTAFGGADSPVGTQDPKPVDGVCPGGRAVSLPMVGVPIAVGYHIPGVKNLTLDATTLAKVFDARITTWDDPAIRKLNPGVELPSLRIRPVHQSGYTGTTQNFQAYLAGAAPKAWPYQAELIWQGTESASASGSAAVASAVGSTAGSIGYFELSFAATRELRTVRIDTGAAEPVAATEQTAAAGIAGATVVGTGKDMPLRFDYRTSVAGAYPIVLVSYEIVCDRGNRAETLPALKSFLTYVASNEGQQSLAELGCAPLPESVAAEVRRVVGDLS